jgi:hypothetical protein
MTTGVSLHLMFATVHVVVVAAALRGRPVTGARIVAAVAILLVIDNLILAAGSVIGEGEALRSVSLVRFAGHTFVTPLLVVAARSLAAEGGVRWATRPPARAVASGLCGVLIAVGIATDLVGLELAPILEGGVLRYHDPMGGPPVPAIVTLVAVLILSVPLGRAGGGWGPLVGGALMFVASALDPLVDGPVLGNAGEVALLLGLTASIRTLRVRRGEGVAHAPA